jgi:hypothetical protein
MQTKKIGDLPTVEELTKISNKTNMVHGWNCDFETDLNKIKLLTKSSNNTNASCINDLLKGFFEFYSNFNFSSRIIYTRTATTANISIDTHSETKTDLSKISEYINVQDPFDLSHNLTANVSKSTVERFIAECKGSSDLLTYSVMPRKPASTLTHKCWGLILLMTKKLLPVLSPSSSRKITISTVDLVEKSLLKLKPFNNDGDKHFDDDQFTVNKSVEFVLFLVKNCLLFQQLEGDKMIVKKHKRVRSLNQICDKVDSLGLNNSSPKRLRTNFNTSSDPMKPSSTFVCVLDNESNYESNDEAVTTDTTKTISSYQFNALYNTWQGRRAVKRTIQKERIADSDFDDLMLEKFTSTKIVEKNLNKPVNNSKGFNFAIHFLDSSIINQKACNNLQIKFELLDEMESQSELVDFTTLVHFLGDYLNNGFEKLFSKWITGSKFQTSVYFRK